jgi:hypothetical protein
LNDPVGFSYKLQEYFSPGVLDLDFLSPYALGIAIILVIIELVLGIALIIGYYKKATLGLLLVMILFFTFLTFYSAYYNKVTDCGCFGDALPLTPWQSFSKDVVLLVMIMILIVGQRYLQPFFTRFGRTIVIFGSFVACLVFGYYVLMHLPAIDFRAYHIGANIEEGMQVPEGAQEAVYEYSWKFKENGEEKIITTTGDYPQSDGEFIGVETEMIHQGYLPPIHDFSVEKNGEDYTEQFLNTENLLVIVAYDISKTEWNGWPNIKKLTDDALKKGYEVIGLSASGENITQDLITKQKLNFEFYATDATTLKTIVRSNPGIVKLREGTILQKKHWNDVDEIDLETLATAKPNLDLSLKFKLDTIARLNNQYWELAQLSGAKKQETAFQWGIRAEDSEGDWGIREKMLEMSNLDLVTSYLNKNKYPGKDTVGEPTNLVAFEIIKHNPEQIPQYLDVLKKAGREGQLPFTLVAELEDRYLMREGKPQVYGTQAWVTSKHGTFIWPITEPDTVNYRRKNAGFTLKITDYAKELIESDHEYTAMTVAQIEKL